MKILNLRWVVILFLVALSLPRPADAQMVPFKIYITSLWQLDTGVDPGVGVIGDYYAVVTVNGVQMSNKQGSDGACNDESSTGILVPFPLFNYFDKISQCGVKTPWVFTTQVPAGQPVHVNIDLFDADLISDDEADLKVGSGSSLNLVVDPANGGKWTGDIVWPQDCSRPDLVLGGQNANVCFQVGFDTDDDGLLDVWEQFGVDTDNDSVIDIDLPSLGANPLHKDVFVEADYLVASNHSHAPQAGAVKSIVSAFANAPVSNPDGTTGIQLHVDVGPLYGTGVVTQVVGLGGVTGTYGDLGGGNEVAEAGNEIIEGFDTPQGTATQFDDLKKTNFDPKREPIFRYNIWGHQTNVRAAINDCTSGDTAGTRREFMVTLGGLRSDGTACWSTDSGGFSVGDSAQQGGTFMHELGHALGLRHGGNVDTNNKPNYLSVMNYSFQDCFVPGSVGLLPGGCDYSRLVSGAVLPPLDETNLDECVGIGGGLGFGAMDWNGDGLFEGTTPCGKIFSNVIADVNNDGVCVSPGANGKLDTMRASDDVIKDTTINDGPNRFCDTPIKTMSDDLQTTAVGFTPTQPNPLASFDDWNSINPSVLTVTGLSASGTSDIEPEPDPDTLRQSRQYLSTMLTPVVSLSETGPATAKPGDQLTYVITTKNTGRGPALSAVLRATNPDGAVQTSPLGSISVGSVVVQNASFTVPANACPGTFTGANAFLTFNDFAGQPMTGSASAPLQVLDVVPPAVTVSLSPSVLWPPNHKFVNVTATISAKDNCDANPSVVLVSISSNEPPNNKEPDIQGAAFGTDDRVFSLRSERDTGKGSTGRVYTVTYRVTDKSGNATVKSAIVTVPTSNSGH